MADEDQPPAAASKLSQLRIDRTALAPARRRRGRWKWIVAALVLLAAAGLVFAPRKAEVQTTTVLTSYPSMQYAQLTASGYVVAQRRAAVASKATGRLLELNVREGSQVKKGEVIARLDASDVQAAIASAQAGVRQAEAALAQARVEAANAEAEQKRTQGLQAQGFVSPQAVDAALTRANAARAAVASAEAGLAQARAQVNVQRVNENFTEIRAPFDGVVLVKNANVGDIITPFSSAAGSQGAVVTMADMSTLEVEADVSESNLSKARIGQPVEITLDALPDARFRGQVGGIVPTVDRAKATVMTKIRFEKLDARILPEMSAKVTFLSQPATDADQRPVLAVNPEAVTERSGAKVVLRLAKQGEDEVLEAVEVTPGRKLGDLLEVSSGTLKSGERLVLKPADTLQAGTKVAVAAK
jgi:HlyD family secretion protein